MRSELAGLLASADVSQAAFARLAGVTARQVNNWCRGRAAGPRWAMLLAAVLREHSPDALAMLLEVSPPDEFSPEVGAWNSPLRCAWFSIRS